MWDDRVKLPLWERMPDETPSNRMLQRYMRPEGERFAPPLEMAQLRWESTYIRVLVLAGVKYGGDVELDGFPRTDAVYIAWRDTFSCHGMAVADWRADLLRTAVSLSGDLAGPEAREVRRRYDWPIAEVRQEYGEWAASLRQLWEENPEASAYDAYQLASEDCLIGLYM